MPVVPIGEFRLALDDWLETNLGDEGRKEIFVAFAEEEISAFEDAWRSRLASSRIETAVDGRRGAPIEAVKIPGGVVSARINAIKPIVDRGFELLDQFTKVVTGGFKSKTYLFVNDVKTARADDVDLGNLVTIANVSDFARLGEQRGFTKTASAPFSDGLFEGVAAMLRREFRASLNSVYFTYRDYGIGPGRVPTIAIGENANRQGSQPSRAAAASSPSSGRRLPSNFAARYAKAKGR